VAQQKCGGVSWGGTARAAVLSKCVGAHVVGEWELAQRTCGGCGSRCRGAASEALLRAEVPAGESGSERAAGWR
jgi:hypothetical protein